MISKQQLADIYPFAPKSKVDLYFPLFNQYLGGYEINSKNRQAAFLAQIGHESGQLHYTEEIASGKAYEGRRDLGNLFKGDGVRFKGRGLIQITGRSNYVSTGKALGLDLVNYPEQLKEPQLATQSACWWWYNRGLNQIADVHSEVNFKKITRIINGGYNGYADRFKIWQRALQVLD